MSTSSAPVEQFAALSDVPCINHAFLIRTAGIDVNCDKEEVLCRLENSHHAALTELGLSDRKMILCQQVHGNNVAIVDRSCSSPVNECDGLATDDPAVLLGIYVADCCPAYLVDPVHRAVALLHSGKKGTELDITTRAIESMAEQFGSHPKDMVAQLGPCIRPPHYEIDFAATILSQCRQSGIKEAHDCGKCTGSDLQRYYSYRMEKGKTGRMLAVLGLKA